MSEPVDPLAPLRKFRMSVVRLSLMLTAFVAIAARFYDPIAMRGVIIGGLGGLLGFWMMARRFEKLASIPANKVKFAILGWSFYRFVLYGAILFMAYMLDKENMIGVWAAVAGILLVRVVLMFIGLTGVDLGVAKVAPEEPEDKDT